MAPFSLVEMFGQTGFYGIVLLIGIGFGAALEMSGFGDSRKLAAQFYFRDMTVLKVMFSSIIVAMTLIFLTSSLGWLDYDYLWVNPTFMLPGIVGGLIMGVGFVIGGFCPGTSLVAMASLKIDGLLFVLGTLFGVFIFGDTIDSTFAQFWISTDMGRFTLQDWLGVDAGVVVFLIVLIALGMFYGAEKVEAMSEGKTGVFLSNRRFTLAAASTLALVALVVMILGQPTIEERWSRLPDETRQKLVDKSVFIEPIEMLHVMKGRNAQAVPLDIRSEAQFNLFHLVDSERTTLAEFSDTKQIQTYKNSTDRVYFIIADEESQAAEAWKKLTAQKVPNVYILDRGIDGWIAYFNKHGDTVNKVASHERINLSRIFKSAVGSNHELANPDFHHYKDIKFTPKVKLAKTRAGGGGCG